MKRTFGRAANAALASITVLILLDSVISSPVGVTDLRSLLSRGENYGVVLLLPPGTGLTSEKLFLKANLVTKTELVRKQRN
jgi:hypothetical protein